MFIFTSAVLLLALAFVAPSTHAQCDIPRQSFTPNAPEVYTCEGIRYHVVAPPACVTAACGLIFDAHGFTMTADGQDQGTNLRQLGYDAGYVVVNPEKPSRLWIPATDHDSVFSFFDTVAATYNVNRSRTHFTGFSMGGLMTWDAACRHASEICSAAPLAASGYDWWALLAEDCWSNGARNDIGLPARVPDLLYVAGTLDKLATWGNAQRRRDDVLDVYNTTARDGDVISEDGEHIRTRWVVGSVADPIAFEFVQHDYSAYRSTGHCFPQVNPADFPFSCKNDRAAWNVGEIVLDFFLNHPC